MPNTEQMRAYGPDVRLEAHPSLGPDRLTRIREGLPVAIVGLGTVGSRLGLALATLGVPLYLFDSGRVESVNAGFQAYDLDDVGQTKCDALTRRIHAVRGGLAVRCFPADVRAVGPGALCQCRLVIGCVDSFAARVWLARTTTALAVPYLDLALDGTGNSLYGRVSGFDTGHGTACLGCGWDDHNWEIVNREQEGSGCAALAASAPEAPSTVALPGLAECVAGLGAIQAIRILLDNDSTRVLGREWRLNLSAGRLDETRLEPDQGCRLEHRPWTVVKLEHRPSELTIRQLFDRAADQAGGECVLGVDDNPLVLAAGCSGCRREVALVSLRSSLPICATCNLALVPLVWGLRPWFGRAEASSFADRTWAELGLAQGAGVLARHPGRPQEIALLFDVDSLATGVRPTGDR
jgi:molybdopterin/thiamine biosynthesis adenylyltransferase